MDRFLRLAAIPFFLALLAGSALADGLLTPMGPVAAQQQLHLWRVIGITAIAVVPVLVGVPIIVWRYRRQRHSTYRPDFGFSGHLEAVMWGVPVVLVAILGFWLWQSTVRLDPYKPLGPDPLEIDVVGLDWKWLFLYPEQHLASVGTLVLPVDRPVQLRLTTDTVMQSFMIPSLAGQVYAMPGMISEQNLVADTAGITKGRNVQFNGAGFARQDFPVNLLPDAQWQAWTAGHADAPALDADAYAQLARAGTLDDAREQFGLQEGSLVLNLVDESLFQSIVGRYHDGRPVEPASQPGAAAYLPGNQP